MWAVWVLSPRKGCVHCSCETSSACVCLCLLPDHYFFSFLCLLSFFLDHSTFYFLLFFSLVFVVFVYSIDQSQYTFCVNVFCLRILSLLLLLHQLLMMMVFQQWWPWWCPIINCRWPICLSASASFAGTNCCVCCTGAQEKVRSPDDWFLASVQPNAIDLIILPPHYLTAAAAAASGLLFIFSGHGFFLAFLYLFPLIFPLLAYLSVSIANEVSTLECLGSYRFACVSAAAVCSVAGHRRKECLAAAHIAGRFNLQSMERFASSGRGLLWQVCSSTSLLVNDEIHKQTNSRNTDTDRVFVRPVDVCFCVSISLVSFPLSFWWWRRHKLCVPFFLGQYWHCVADGWLVSGSPVFLFLVLFLSFSILSYLPSSLWGSSLIVFTWKLRADRLPV